MDFHPGPKDPSILWDQMEHRSEDVWNGKTLKERSRKVKCDEGGKLSDFKLTKAQKELLEQWGFGVFTDQKVLNRMDGSLITALVERWRSETNTFHFEIGEMTITLEDVYFILGLPVIGKPITCGLYAHPRKELWQTSELYEFVREGERAYDRGGISTTWLAQRFGVLPSHPSRRLVAIYTKAYVMYILGRILFSSSSRNVVHPRYLLFLENVTEISEYAWGAAVLACLYRSLHKASRRGAKALNGCSTLLQVWAYERITIGRPTHPHGRERYLPRARGWAYRRGEDLMQEERWLEPHHNLPLYRTQLERMNDNMVTWMPYLPYEDRQGPEYEQAIFAACSRVPLIWFDVVEFQMSDRALRQFGDELDIPLPPPDMRGLRHVEKARVPDAHDHRKLRQEYLEMWDNWQKLVIDLGVATTKRVTVQQYLQWYRRITRLRIEPPNIEENDKFATRGLFSQYDAWKLIHTAMDFVKKWLQVPPVCEDRSVYLDWYVRAQDFDSHTRGHFGDASQFPTQSSFQCASPIPNKQHSQPVSLNAFPTQSQSPCRPDEPRSNICVTQYGLHGLLKAWTPHDEYLIELLLEQHNCGKTTYNLFRHEVFKTVTRKLKEKFGVNLEESQIQIRYNAMKKDYGVIKTILGHPGFYWDVNKQMVVADDEVWEKYTAVRTDARPYRLRTFPPYDQMSIIFEETVSDDGSVRKLQFPVRVNTALEEVNNDPETVQSSDPNNQPSLLVYDKVDLAFCVNNTQPQERNSTPFGTSALKDCTLEAEDSIENVLCESPAAARIVHGTVNKKLPKKRKSTGAAISGCNKRAQVETDDCTGNASYDNVKDERALYQRCLEELQRIEELNDSEFATAVNLLKDEKNAIAFLTIKGPRRVIWLRSILLE